ncbi:NAD-dependent epimerase/dehydratase family protein [Eikenella sp. S3360]|uniref:NAD-dependent epimerase/dehydratase family protein n=1 Tax=Eikenella glucosivorans TaxID=2766967 RepID=A0ABS0ND24_9NEIS|nr:NAD-dependent epimerase/dehydratase family protein [Eikenella glucosivorans]MBH5330231.1 NAD-dependent epimerase/dehydratase family protein [Eikenella glucosivorans]
MNILLFGGSGFIGRRAAYFLRQRGHTVHTPPRHDFNYLHPSEAAARRLMRGCDAVFNCTGVMSRRAEVLETIHCRTPALLARLAAQAGVRHWVQLSALGAHPAHAVAFVGSKGRGDEAVCRIGGAGGMRVLVACPSLVYGRGGASCELFICLALLPVLPLPGGGRFEIQPVHAADVAHGLAELPGSSLPHGAVVNMAGSRAFTLATYLAILRQTLFRRPPPRILPIPLPLIRPVLPLANLFSNGMISAGSLALLQQGACASSQPFAELLGRQPLAAEEFAAHE